MESSPREDAVKVAEMTKDLEYHINLVEKAATEFEKSDCKFERSRVGKILPNSVVCYRETVHERESQLVWQTALCLILRHCSHPSLQQHHRDLSTAINAEARPATSKRLQLAEGSDDG